MLKRLTLLFLLLSSLNAFCQSELFSFPHRRGWLVAKVIPSASVSSVYNSPDVASWISSGNIISMNQRIKTPPDYKPGRIDLSKILALQVNGDEKWLAEKLLKTNLFQYVEPWLMPELCYAPNDPSIALQYHIAKIQAPDAWDISQGDTNMVVGVTDTGIDLFHPDIQPNLSFNHWDPVDNTDNDNDGYVDNFQGWDLGENDASPQCNANWHGLHVSGISSAATDNNLGVAGVGFKCRLLPVKISDASGALTMAYDGIVYAADHGCRIINCSWGGFGGGQFGQDIVNYAVFDKNSLVVASAGNNGDDQLFYPASYRNVISVAASDQNDLKKANSTFGIRIDLAAPGEDIFSTWVNAGYTASGGTSSAGPVVAGAAAIVKSFFPSFSALQVGEQLKATADIIDTIQQNLPYKNKLGRGRVNLYRALTETNHPSVVLVDDHTTDNGDMAFTVGDTLSISGVFVNYLNLAPGVTVQCASNSSFIQMIDSVTSLGDIQSLDSANNSSDPFKALILPGAPVNHKVEFTLTINTSSGYQWYEYVTVMVNVDYLNISVNLVSTSITSRGNIGFNGLSSGQGLGFVFSSQNLLFEAGLMLSAAPGNVSDRVRGNAGSNDADLLSVVNIHPLIPSAVSDFDCEGVFNDSGSISPIPVKVIQSAYAWDTPGNDQYVRFDYRIVNTGTSPLIGLHAGIFADWDIMNASLNRADTDTQNRMGYCFTSQPQGLYAAIQLLSPQTLNVYGIDLVAGGAGGVNLSDGFDSQEKFTTMSTSRIQAGTGGSGNDVAQVVSAGPFDLNPDDTVEVAFAIHAGFDLTQLQSSAQNAQLLYNGSPVGAAISEKIPTIQIFPNPADEFSVLSIPLDASAELFNASGQKVPLSFEVYGPKSTVRTSQLPDGIYLLRIPQRNSVLYAKFAVLHKK